MNIYEIIDPVELERVRKKNAEQVYFQQLQQLIITKINKEWKSNKSIHETIKNKYYNLEYTIENCYNQTGNRTLTFLNSGKKIHDYNYFDIKNWLKNYIKNA